MTATLLPLTEAVTTESSTPEGSKNYGLNSYLEETKMEWLRSQAQNIILEDAKKNKPNSRPESYNSGSFTAKTD